MLKAIIFDFDGVICESVEVKTGAFRKLFQSYPKHLDQILRFHMDNGGMSRFEKFKIIYRDFLRQELTANHSRELGRKFTQYSYQAVLDSPSVKGAGEFLKKYHQTFLFFIVSGTPQEEMVSIVKEKGLGKYFQGVYGAPRLKGELLAMILKQHGLRNNEAVFVGDSRTDYEGADQVGIKFIGRLHAGYPNPFLGVQVDAIINDLSELYSKIKNLQ